jgi:hypothetical protein
MTHSKIPDRTLAVAIATAVFGAVVATIGLFSGSTARADTHSSAGCWEQNFTDASEGDECPWNCYERQDGWSACNVVTSVMGNICWPEDFDNECFYTPGGGY